MKRHPSIILLIWITALLLACVMVELSIVFGYTEKGLLHQILYVWAALLLAIAIADRLMARYPPLLAITRDMPAALAQAQWNDIHLHISNQGAHPLRLQITDLVSSVTESEDNEHQVLLKPQQSIKCSYRLRCCERGDLAFGDTQIRYASPLKLWQCTTTMPTRDTVRVFPAFSHVDQFEELVKSHQTMMLGLRKRPRRGDGTDFARLPA